MSGRIDFRILRSKGYIRSDGDALTPFFVSVLPLRSRYPSKEVNMRRNLVLLALFILVFALPVLAQTNGDEKPSMSVAEAAIIVAGIVTFIKMKIFPALWDKLGDAGKFVLSILTSVGVVAYKYLTEGLTLNAGAIWFLVEVVIAVTSGYVAAKSILPGLSRTNLTKR